MLQINQSDTTASLVLTLTENVSINDPYFLFVFTHVLTKQVVKFLKFAGDDASNHIARYNEFVINAAVTFLNKPVGEYHYKVYEQASSTNLDVSLTGAVLEYGKLKLNRVPAFLYTKYNEPTTFKTYNG